MNYFSPIIPDKRPTNAFNALKGASPVMCTDRMPLILQHAGHSRTVVGFEVNKKGCPNLLIFDPSIRPSQQLRRTALTKHSSTSPSPSPSKRKGSSSILHRVLHPQKTKTKSESRKRRASNPLLDADGREVKRVRGGLQGPSSNDDEVIILEDVEDDDDVQMDEEMDMTKVVNFFRVNQSKLGRNDRYQILYFPLDPPLEDEEKWARRVVTSDRVV